MSTHLAHQFQGYSRNASELRSRFHALQPGLVGKSTLNTLWKDTLGTSVPNKFVRLVVVGQNRTELSRWSTSGDVLDRFYPEERVDPVAGDMVLFLGGSYEAADLWATFDGPALKGAIILAEVGEARQNAIISNERVEAAAFPSVDQGGLVAFVGLSFWHGAKSNVATIAVRGALRMIDCQVITTPGDEMREGIANGGVETTDLITVEDQGDLLAESTVLVGSTLSGISTYGKSHVDLNNCVFSFLGRGDYVQRKVNKNDDHRSIRIRGLYPAIQLSFETNMRVTACVFDRNYGLPIQYRGDGDRGTLSTRFCENNEHNPKSVMIHSPVIDMLGRDRSNVQRVADEFTQDEVDIASAFVRKRSDSEEDVEAIFLSAWREPSPQFQEAFTSMTSDTRLIDRLQAAVSKITEDFWDPRIFLGVQNLKVKTDDKTAIWRDTKRKLPCFNPEDFDRFRQQRNAKIAKCLTNIFEEMLSRFGAIHKEQILDACWGCLIENQKTSCEPGDLFLAALTIAAFCVRYAARERLMDAHRAKILMDLLRCNEYAVSVGCTCEQQSAASVQAVLCILGKDGALCQALVDVVEDGLETDHTRRRAARMLAGITFWQLSVETRKKAIDVVSKAVCIQKDNELRLSTRSHMIATLKLFLAKACRPRVRKAFENHNLDWDIIDGGYISYLMKVGLPVDTSDAIVREEMDNEPRKYSRERMEAFNQLLESSSSLSKCWFCYDMVNRGRLFECTQCGVALYCGEVCQTADWTVHQQTCTPSNA